MDPFLFKLAQDTKGFMPDKEGLKLYEVACKIDPELPILEIGAYCGKSTVYLGAAAKTVKSLLFSLDHHRGSEENQIGWEHFDESLFDENTGKLETLFEWRKTITKADFDPYIVGLIGDSSAIGKYWNIKLAMLFIDGGHGEEPAWNDFKYFAKHLCIGGILAIHDVFPDPKDGGRPPYEIYLHAKKSGDFIDFDSEGSLRILKRI